MYNVEVEEFHTYFAGKGGGCMVPQRAEETYVVPKAAVGEETAAKPGAVPAAGNRDIHRIGGANVENLRLKSREATLNLDTTRSSPPDLHAYMRLVTRLCLVTGCLAGSACSSTF